MACLDEADTIISAILIAGEDSDQFSVVDPKITLAERTVGRSVLRDGPLTTVDLSVCASTCAINTASWNATTRRLLSMSHTAIAAADR